VCGNADGTIRFYDFYFKVVAWFEDELKLSTIKSISFSKTDPKAAADLNEEVSNDFMCSDFIATDESALVSKVWASIFEEIDPLKKKGELLMWGFNSSITAIAVHPNKPIVAIAGKERFVVFWDYQKKGERIYDNYELFSKEDSKEKDSR